jgi:hypothetical protein
MLAPGLDALVDQERTRWVAYVSLHEHGQGKEALVELEALLFAFERAQPERRRRFAEAICAAWIDPLEPGHGPPTLLRYPLIREVLLPYLRPRMGRPGNARRIAAMASYGLYRGNEYTQLPTPRDLLERAVHGGDAPARHWLLACVLSGLEDAFRELPWGVLASGEELEADADWLERLAPEFAREEQLTALAAYAREHARAWREFAERADGELRYADVMDERGIAWD